MNGTNVSRMKSDGTTDLLTALADGLDELTPETRKAATYVLENPNEVGISSIREIAEAANVKPNTLVRLARSVGFDGTETQLQAQRRPG